MELAGIALGWALGSSLGRGGRRDSLEDDGYGESHRDGVYPPGASSNRTAAPQIRKRLFNRNDNPKREPGPPMSVPATLTFATALTDDDNIWMAILLNCGFTERIRAAASCRALYGAVSTAVRSGLFSLYAHRLGEFGPDKASMYAFLAVHCDVYAA